MDPGQLPTELSISHHNITAIFNLSIMFEVCLYNYSITSTIQTNVVVHCQKVHNCKDLICKIFIIWPNTENDSSLDDDMEENNTPDNSINTENDIDHESYKTHDRDKESDSEHSKAADDNQEIINLKHVIHPL